MSQQHVNTKIKQIKIIFVNVLLISFSSLIGVMAINIYLDIVYDNKKMDDIFEELLEIKSGKISSEKTLPFLNAAKKLNIPYDERHFTQFIEDEMQKGEKVTQSLSSQYFVAKNMNKHWHKNYFHPGGVSRIRTVMSNENGYFAEFFSDRYGFNNPDGIWDKINRGEVIDAILVGDSFTQGYSVKQYQSIAGILRSRGLSVLNLGRGGNGPLSNLAAFMEYGAHVKARFVIYIHFNGNDLSDLSWEQPTILSNYLNKSNFSQNLIQKDQALFDKDLTKLWNALSENYKNKTIVHKKNVQALIERDRSLRDLSEDELKNLASIIKKERENQNDIRNKGDNPLHRIATLYHIRQLLKPIKQILLPCDKINKISTKHLYQNLGILEKIIAKIKTISEENRSNFIFVSNPEREIIYGLIKRSKNSEICLVQDFNPILLSNIKKRKIKLINLEPILMGYKNKSKLFPLGGFDNLGIASGHYSPLGYEIIANVLHREIFIKNLKK